MYLKKLELQGFKSFPEYTVIEFGPGMTAVVGPNGSGKSNVTDAVRWVLGEMSVKTLRGGKMEDVIFNGTSTRKPMNYAEVTLTLDNTDRKVDLDFPEIQITRRLYRSGESEYQINKVNCRLKDITGMFLDTGLGKDGYSIVGQGRVDEVLSNKSEDRRRIMEEAAGIVKYKMRKEEAERKLASAENNLLRLNDILGELESRRGPLEDQAEKAKKYHKAYEELKEKEIGLLCHKITVANEAMGGSADVRESLEADIRAEEDRFNALRAENSEFTGKLDAMDNQIEELRQELSDLTEEDYTLDADKKVVSERRDAALEQMSRDEAELKTLEEALNDLAATRQQHKDKAAELLDKANEIKTELESLNSERDTVASEFAEKEKGFKSINEAIEGKTNELFEVRGKITSETGRIEGFDERIKEESATLNELKERRKTLESDLKDADKAWHDMVAKEAEVKGDIEKRDTKLAGFIAKQTELNQFFDTNNRQLVTFEARLKSLKDLEKRKEGYQESVRKLTAAAAEDKSIDKLIVGVLGDLISVDTKYETAIEIALGNAIHNIVTDTEEDASELIDILKTRKLGRITFLPIENIRPRDIQSDTLAKASKCKGYINVAADLVECDNSLRDIVSNLLGKIIVADNLENARKIASTVSYSVKIITLEGDSVNPGGSLTGGSVRKSGVGILGRAREIEDLTKKIDSLEGKLADSEATRQETDDKIGSLNRELEQLGEQLKYFSVERVKAENNYRNCEAKLEECDASVKSCEETIDSVSKQKLRVEDDIEEYSRIESELSGELDDFKESIAQRDALSAEYTGRLDAIREKISAEGASAERVLAERNGVLELAEHIKGQIKQTETNIEAKKGDIKECENRISEAEKTSASIDRKKVKIAADEKVLSDKIEGLFAERDKISADMSGFADRLSASSELINSLRNKLTNHVAKYEKYINDIDESKNKLWEDYEVTYDNVKADYEPVKEVGARSREISSLKATIRDLGPVNLNSIEEFRELSERYDFMTSQRDDILKSKTDLEKIISDLLDEMRVQFIEHFNIINENFKTVFADLFGGGTSEIVLDSDDVLNCAIEIKAQPPGKKLQNLSLLSGGERCLTAIALLFAILELKPSPFVILDEVEAALDDINIVRFTDFVRRYCARTQFILVTHRKGTMEACDRMYGVTMAERGISKILSMELKS